MTKSFTYGRSAECNYAVALYTKRHCGIWEACEVDGELYRIIEFDEIPERDWERIDALEERSIGGP